MGCVQVECRIGRLQKLNIFIITQQRNEWQWLDQDKPELSKNAGIKIKVFFILYFYEPDFEDIFALKSVFRHICIFSQT